MPKAKSEAPADAPVEATGGIEFYVKVRGHYDFDISNPDDVKRVYVIRDTVMKTVLSEQGILDTMRERGIPRNRAIEDLFVEANRTNVLPEDIVSISSDQPGPLERVTSLYEAKSADLGPASMSDPKHVKSIQRAEPSHVAE